MMRLWLVCLPLLIAAAFVVGRATSPDAASASAMSHVYTGRIGDAFRIPAAATRCVVSQEGGAANVVCAHTPKSRYSVVFFRDNLFVYRTGNPDNPVFSARGTP